jgi:L-lactate dehydrogenase complex protein LldF
MNDSARQFQRDAAAKAGDLQHRTVIQRNMAFYDAAVARSRSRYADWQNARSCAAQIKWDAINHLDRYLEQFERNVIANGGHVHWAETSEQAREIILGIARRHQVRKIVKSKSMATEEIHLNDALAQAGIEAVETDLGEFICQLRGEPPYHIITPAMHLSRAEIGRDFARKLGISFTDDATELAGAARVRLRREFQEADMGVTGANFLVADTGMIAITENEGNARLSFSLPRVHVALAGIEKVIPCLADLALLWPLLASSGTGQSITCYNSLVGGPRTGAESDGPIEFHVVLLDNGRTRLLADAEQRDSLHCIRCGACLNACPVYRTIGGHTYRTTYQGPIGSVITPHLRGADEWSHLPFASSLCGNCTDVCPVRVDLHHHLLHNRRNAVRRRFNGPLQRLGFRFWLWVMQSPDRYRLAGKLAAITWRLGIGKPALRPWTGTRELAQPAKQTFRDWWSSRSHDNGGSHP